MPLPLTIRSWILPVLFSGTLAISDEPAAQPKKQQTPGEQYELLVKEYRAADAEFEKTAEAAKTDEDFAKITEMQKNLRKFPGRFIDLARVNPSHPIAIDALAWVIFNLNPRFPEVDDAVELLIHDHIASDKLGSLLPTMWGRSGPPIEKLFRAALEKSPKREVKGLGCFSLAKYCKVNAERGQLRALLPKSTTGAASDFEKLSEEAAFQFERVIREFGDMKYYSTTLGEVAEKELFQLTNLAIGMVAPEIVGEDVEGRAFKLSDYRGRVVVLSFWGHWCGPCQGMYPHERSLVNRLDGKPFTLLGINSDEDKDMLMTVLKEQQITWRFWWDGGGTNGPIASLWHITAWPTVYVLDHKGVIRYKGVSGRTMDDAVDTLLAELDESKKQTD